MAKTQRKKAEIKIQLVVCCKDCKYAHLDYSGCNKYCDRFPELEDPYFPSDFYCGFAEAKDD